MTEQQRDRWHGIAVTERVVEQSNQPVGDGASPSRLVIRKTKLCSKGCLSDRRGRQSLRYGLTEQQFESGSTPKKTKAPDLTIGGLYILRR